MPLPTSTKAELNRSKRLGGNNQNEILASLAASFHLDKKKRERLVVPDATKDESFFLLANHGSA